MKTWTMLALISLSSLALGACSSTASLVRSDSGGGKVRLEGAYMPAMGEARMVMLEHCGGRFEYRELGEEVAFRCKTGHTTEAPRSAELASAASPRF